MPEDSIQKEFDALLCEYLDGELSDDAVGEFVRLLEAEPVFTVQLRDQLAMDARLAQFESGEQGEDEFLFRLTATLEAEKDGGDFVGRVVEIAAAEDPAPSRRGRRLVGMWMGAAAAALTIGLFFLNGLLPVRTDTVAVVTALKDCRWLNPESRFGEGDALAIGDRIEVSSGSAEFLFESGAELEVFGPAIFEMRSHNSGFLTMGEVHLVAETPESKGFVVETPTSKFVDIGTAFTAQVSPDGFSRLEVTDGEVDVVLEGSAPRRVKVGEMLLVEPGDRKILTRIESGDGTASFQFPTIEPPGSDDYADNRQGRASVAFSSQLARRSGPPSRLFDGSGQTAPDSPSESLFFAPGNRGRFVIDLGVPVSISKINSYSWHQHDNIENHRTRARQKYTLYGSISETSPDFEVPEELLGNEWIRIARVHSDRFFKVQQEHERPAQQASSITAEKGDIGRYRYLLWVVDAGTFYGEIDVFANP